MAHRLMSAKLTRSQEERSPCVICWVLEEARRFAALSCWEVNDDLSRVTTGVIVWISEFLAKLKRNKYALSAITEFGCRIRHGQRGCAKNARAWMVSPCFALGKWHGNQ